MRQGYRVFTLQDQLVLFTGAAQAHLEPCARQFSQRGAHVALNDLLARALATLVQNHRQSGFAHFSRTAALEGVRPYCAPANGGVDAGNVFHATQQAACALGSGAGLGQGAARWQFHIHLRLRVVVRRNEAAGNQGHQKQRADKEADCHRHGDPAVVQRPAGNAQVQRHPHGLFMHVGGGFHDVGRHHRCEQTRHQQRGKNRKHRGPAKLFEEFAHYAVHEGGGQKHGNQRKGGGNHGQANFVSCFHGGLVGRLAHAQVAFNVFHLHNGIVHQNADDQRHGQQRHHVDRETHVVHTDEGRYGRQRQRHSRHKGGAPVAQKEPHHNHRQDGTFVQHGHGGVKLLLHRCHKVKGLRQLQVGVAGFEFGQCLLHGGTHFNLTGAFAAGHFKTHHLLAVEQRNAARLGHRVFDGGYFVQAYASAAGQGQFGAGQLGHGGHRGQGAHGLLATAQVGAATGTFGLYLLELA